MPHPLTGPALGFAARLRFPTLFKLTLALFLLDLFVPDIIPFIDEILFGLVTLLLANWRKPSLSTNSSAENAKTIEGKIKHE